MKKFIALTIILLTVGTCSLSAQNKGDMNIGGMLGAGISSTFIHGLNSSTTSTMNASATLDFGYFVANRLKLGIDANYAFSAGDGNIHAVVIGPNITYYARLAENLYYTPSFAVSFALGASAGETIPGFGIGLNLFGLEFRPTEHLGITTSIASISYVELFDFISTSTLGIDIGVNPTIGFKYYF